MSLGSLNFSAQYKGPWRVTALNMTYAVCNRLVRKEGGKEGRKEGEAREKRREREREREEKREGRREGGREGGRDTCISLSVAPPLMESRYQSIPNRILTAHTEDGCHPVAIAQVASYPGALRSLSECLDTKL